MHNKMQKKVIIVSLATAFLVVGCNGGGNSSTPSSNTAVSTSPVAAQLVAAEQKVELINDLSNTPFSFVTTKIGATDVHSFKFVNTTGYKVVKTVLKLDNPNFKVAGGFMKISDGIYQNSSYLASDQGVNFNITYTGTSYTPDAQATTLTVEYYVLNEKGVQVSVPGVASFPLQYQTTNGPAVIAPSTTSILFREVLANNTDSDSYLLSLTNNSETPSGKIEFNVSPPFSIESTTCTTLAAHDSCSVQIGFGKTTNISENNKANLEIKYFEENSNINPKTTTVALNGTTVPADKVYVKLESAVAGGRLFGGDGTIKTPYNVELGGSPLNFQLTYRNTGSSQVDNFNIDASKLPIGYTLIKNDCTNATLPSNASCNVSLNAASRKLGSENLDLSAIPASWTGHSPTTLGYLGSNSINVNIHPKSSYLLETEWLGKGGVAGYDPWERQPGKTRYFQHDDLIKVYVSGTNLDSPNLDLRIDPKSLPAGMECVGGDDENGDSCKAILTYGNSMWLGLVADRSVPDGVYHIKATSQGRNISADIMIYGYWQVGNAPANTEISGLVAANNNVYAVAANNTKIFYNNGVVSPKGTHNWSATKGVANMTKLAVNDGSLCLVSNSKDLYSSSNIAKGVQGLTRNFSLTDGISSVACMSGDNKSLASSGNSVYYYDSATKTPQALATALQPITSMVANNSKVYFADNTKTIYTALNNSAPNAPKVSAIPQTGTDIQGQQYWPNYSWLLALSTDKTKLFSQVLNKTNSGTPKIWSTEEMNAGPVINQWIYGSYIYRSADDGVTWNTDTRLGQPWALLLPNFLPTEVVASNQFIWSTTIDKLKGINHPNYEVMACGWPNEKATSVSNSQRDQDYRCAFIETPITINSSNGGNARNNLPDNYGFNHVAYDPTYNMMFFSDNAGNIFGEWATPAKDLVPYPGSPTYY